MRISSGADLNTNGLTGSNPGQRRQQTKTSTHYDLHSTSNGRERPPYVRARRSIHPYVLREGHSDGRTHQIQGNRISRLPQEDRARAGHREEEPIPIKDKKVFNVKREDSVNIYLDKFELTLLEKAIPRLSPADRYYAVKFLVGAYTGCRQSDILHITPAHISHGMLSYVAEKTGKKVTVPITQKTADWITFIQEHYDEFDGAKSTPASQRMVYNRHIRSACKAAYINAPAVRVRGGKEVTEPKWKIVTSHTARRSFATNLYLAGMDPHQVSKLLGHFSAEITLRCYICAERTTMPEAALAYFQ